MHALCLKVRNGFAFYAESFKIALFCAPFAAFGCWLDFLTRTGQI